MFEYNFKTVQDCLTHVCGFKEGGWINMMVKVTKHIHIHMDAWMCICYCLHAVEFTIPSIREEVTGSKSRQVDEGLAVCHLPVLCWFCSHQLSQEHSTRQESSPSLPNKPSLAYVSGKWRTKPQSQKVLLVTSKTVPVIQGIASTIRVYTLFRAPVTESWVVI